MNQHEILEGFYQVRRRSVGFVGMSIKRGEEASMSPARDAEGHMTVQPHIIGRGKPHGMWLVPVGIPGNGLHGQELITMIGQKLGMSRCGWCVMRSTCHSLVDHLSKVTAQLFRHLFSPFEFFQ